MRLPPCDLELLLSHPAPLPRIADTHLAVLMPALTDLVRRASLAIRAVRRDSLGTIDKADGSPVTRADMAAHAVLVDGLAALCPGIPVISEEDAARIHGPLAGSFFLIDPLDGTREYVGGSDEYAVNLALISDGQPRLGIIAGPAKGLIWRGHVAASAECLSFDETGLGSARPIRTRARAHPWTAVVSRSHGDARSEAFIDREPGAKRDPMGSALKFCRIADGSADVYPRLAPTSEWDIAAGHALIEAAGGRMTDGSGDPLRYGQRPDGYRVDHFIAWGDLAASA